MKKLKILVVLLSIIILLASTVITSYADAMLLGDANLNSELDITDVTLIQRDLANLTPLSVQQIYAADANDDGYLAITDATIIQKCLAKIISPKYRDLDNDDALNLPFVPAK
ncbi:MAG: dockerin type I repeat-containing protein [Oscillospiraceae bacterium]|nr:dockerin type I repeat-containing protein [Candidatus Ruminococcus equi]